VSDNGTPTLQYLEPESARGGWEAGEQALLDTINQKVAAAESLEGVMDFVFDSVRQLDSSDRLGLAFVEEDGQRVVAHWARATYEPLMLKRGYAEDLRGSSLGRVLDSREPRIINDLERYLDAHPGSRSTRIIVREGVRSSMTCPLVVEDRPIGFLFRSSRTPGAYAKRHVAMHLAIAERLSQAVEKAYRIEQLAAANRAYFETLGFVSHELRSPLSSLVINGRALTGGYLGEMDPKHRDKVGGMVTKAEYLLGLIEEYLSLARVESGEMKARIEGQVDIVGTLIEKSIDIIQAQLEAKHMTLVREYAQSPTPVACDPSLMRIVLVNLLGNAVKYGDEGGEVRVRAACEDGRVSIAVRNTGPGFPPSERDKLFKRFSRIQTPELMKRKGSGIGLYTSWRIIQAHGGRIQAESEHGAWAEFSFTIPQPPRTGQR